MVFLTDKEGDFCSKEDPGKVVSGRISSVHLLTLPPNSKVVIGHSRSLFPGLTYFFSKLSEESGLYNIDL